MDGGQPMREFLIEAIKFYIEVCLILAFGHLVADDVVRKIGEKYFKED